MKITVLAVMALLLASAAEAQPRKHWFTDPKWWAGEAVIAAAIAADSHSTASRPLGAIETNWLLGHNPSNQKISLVSLGYFGIQTSLHAAAWHVTHHVPIADSCTTQYVDTAGNFRKVTRCTEFDQDRLGWRALGYLGVPVTVGIINGHAAARNYELK